MRSARTRPVTGRAALRSHLLLRFAAVRLQIEIELCREIEPAGAAERLGALIAEAQRRQYQALVCMAMVYRADCLRRC